MKDFLNTENIKTKKKLKNFHFTIHHSDQNKKKEIKT